MKKLLFLFAIFTFCFAFSQNSNSKKIVLGKTMNKAFIVGDKTYKWSEYAQVFKKPEALELIKKARTNNTVGQIFAGIGGGIMGFGLARAISGGSKKSVSIPGYGTSTVKGETGSSWIIAGVGLGVALVGVPFVKAATKNTKKAISIENGESTAFQPYFKFETTGNGLALSYNF